MMTPDREFEEEEENNILEFKPKIITGGKEPADPYETWLQKMPIGNCFFCKETGGRNYELMLGRVADKKAKAVTVNLVGFERPVFVDPVGFCNRFMLYEDLGIITPQEVTTGGEHERDRIQGDPGTPSDPVEGHGGKPSVDEGVQQQSEGTGEGDRTS